MFLYFTYLRGSSFNFTFFLIYLCAFTNLSMFVVLWYYGYGIYLFNNVRYIFIGYCDAVYLC